MLGGPHGQCLTSVKTGGNHTVQGRGQVLEALGRGGVGRPARGEDGKSVCHWSQCVRVRVLLVESGVAVVVQKGARLGKDGVWDEDAAFEGWQERTKHSRCFVEPVEVRGEKLVLEMVESRVVIKAS